MDRVIIEVRNINCARIICFFVLEHNTLLL